MENIEKTRDLFCQAINTDIEKIRERCRAQKITEIRRIYAYILHKKKHTTVAIGKEIHRKHSTVIHLIKTTERLLEIKDREITELYNLTKNI